MKKVVCSKRHLCPESVCECDHILPHKKGEGCEFCYCLILGKDVACKVIEDGEIEEVKK